MRLRNLVLCVATVAMWVACAAPASALTLQAPTVTLDTVDTTVTLASTDPTGTVWIIVDGAVAASRLATPGSEVGIADVRAGLGQRVLRAAIKHPGGVLYSDPVTVTVWATPAAPVMTSPAGGYAAYKAPLRIKPGVGTTTMTVWMNGQWVRKLPVQAGVEYWIANLYLPKGTSTLLFQASNPATTKDYTFTVKRLDFPWPTCIIIDQSEFRLYWVKDGALVKIYPIAHGKPSTPTPNRVWKILAKYHTSPTSVYGPRKMRLFKQSSGGYVYTAYGIHGTNQPWVIGTRASHGCIRMYNKDVLELFPQVPLGTMVQTRP